MGIPPPRKVCANAKGAETNVTVSHIPLPFCMHHGGRVSGSTGSVRLYFQKLACVLHDAYKNELFDGRILQRVKRPKKEQEKKCFLSETELKRLIKQIELECLKAPCLVNQKKIRIFASSNKKQKTI